MANYVRFPYNQIPALGSGGSIPPGPGPIISKPISGTKLQSVKPPTAGFLERLAYRLVRPLDYDLANNFDPSQVTAYQREAAKELRSTDRLRDKPALNRDDAWRTYLGMAARGNALIQTPAGYQLHPELEDDILRDGLSTDVNSLRAGKDIPHTSIRAADYRRVGNEDRWVDTDMSGNIMGNYTVAKGADSGGNYIRYHDNWDLDPTVLGLKIPVEMVAGKPYTIGNKIYYDPKTNKRLQTPLPTKALGGMAPTQSKTKEVQPPQADNHLAAVHSFLSQIRRL